MKHKNISSFWIWFSAVADKLAINVEDNSLLTELDKKIQKLDPRLSWEIGPGRTREWQLVISPNLDVELREIAEAIIAKAPILPQWQFYSSRRPKEWNYQFQLECGGRLRNVDASGWKFVLLEYPDAIFEILLEGQEALSLEDDQRWQAAAIVLESILGEEPLLGKVEFELVDKLESQYSADARPIQELRQAFLGV
ncbi:MAG TPA: hypothetical protein VIW67_17255 [Terriglobales bacterium]|jgi:hypothetical protein